LPILSFFFSFFQQKHALCVDHRVVVIVVWLLFNLFVCFFFSFSQLVCVCVCVFLLLCFVIFFFSFFRLIHVLISSFQICTHMKVRCFLDHLDMCMENDEPLSLMADKQRLKQAAATAAASGTKASTHHLPAGRDVAEEDGGSCDRDAVFLGTVHQSKGLEWDTVFVVRFNEVYICVCVLG
jgi:hypothetical protein